jgi:aminopeptidase 2
MGMLNDSVALAKAGLAPVTGALTLIQGLKNEQEYLVWNSASTGLATVLTTWWENKKVVDLGNSFRKTVFSPIVERLGYEYSSSESADVSLLRTEAITAAAESGDESVVKELQRRFAKFVETGDDSYIPPDLLKITYTVAVKYGGRKEYDAIKAIQEKPKTPSARMAAIRAMCNSTDKALIQETWEYIMTKAKDQDWLYFFAGLSINRDTRRTLNKLFYDNYDTIFAKFAGNATLKYLVQYSISGLSTEKDAKAVEAFFDGKDISRYNLTLAQCIDGIRAKAKWIEKSNADLESWLEKWNENK